MDLEKQLTGRQYMQLKRAKQDSDNEKIRGVKSTIFSGVIVYVNGFVEPPQNELRRIIVEHGGQFLYQPSSEATHIVCMQLSNTKMTKLKPSDVVVTPQWILDSVAWGKLQDTRQYDIRAGKDGDGLQKFLSMAKRKERPNGNDEEELRPDDEAEEYERNVVGEQLKSERDDLDDSSSIAFASGAPDSDFNLGPRRVSSTSVLVADASLNQNRESKELNRENSLTSKDPNFLKHYMARSRLHHLSAWRAQFQEQLAVELSNGGKIQASDGAKKESEDCIIMHVDMDCFFASVAMREDPSLVGKPIIVCANGTGTHGGEVSACNYEAKRKGISSGMFVSEALKLCPEVVRVGYQFELYEATSRCLFSVLLRYTRTLEIISCDEAYVDVTDFADRDPDLCFLPLAERAMALATRIRRDVFEATRCPASIGVSFNMLLARMATAKAKPNNQYLVTPDDAVNFLMPLPVNSLPSVGWSTRKKLETLGVATCGDLFNWSMEALQEEFGPKKGGKLWLYARGICSQKIEPYRMRKSIGLDVNYGIRFDEVKEVMVFIERMCVELINRLGNRRGRRLTVKVMVKRADWKEPTKFLGHGKANSHQKSAAFPRPLVDLASIVSNAKTLYRQFGIAKTSDLVGIGITMDKLEEMKIAAASKDLEQQEEFFKESQPTLSQLAKEGNDGNAAGMPRPPSKYVVLSKDDLDPAVLSELPPDLQREVLASVGERQPKRQKQVDALLRKPKSAGSAASSAPVDDEVWAALPEDVRLDFNRGVVAAAPNASTNAAVAGNGAKRLTQAVFVKKKNQDPVKQEPKVKRERDAVATTSGKQKSPETTSKSGSRYVSIDRSQIDEEALAALPPELREQFLAELAESETRKASKSTPALLSSGANAPAESAFVAPAPAPEPEGPSGSVFAFPAQRYVGWRHELPHFFASFPDLLCDRDVAVLAELLYQFVRQAVEEEFNAEDASKFMHDVRRYMKKRSGRWLEVWNMMIDDVQAIFMEKYGCCV